MGISRDLMSGIPPPSSIRRRSLSPIKTPTKEAALQVGRLELAASGRSRRAGSPPRELAPESPSWFRSCIGRFCGRGRSKNNNNKKTQGGGTKRHTSRHTSSHTGKLPPSISSKVVIIRNKLGTHAENLLKEAEDFRKKAERAEFYARAAHRKDAASRGAYTRQAHATHSIVNEITKERVDALEARDAIDYAIDMATYAAKHPKNKIAMTNAEEALAKARALWQAVFGKVSTRVIAEEEAVEAEEAEAARVYARQVKDRAEHGARHALRMASRGLPPNDIEEFRGHSVLGGGRRRTNRRTHKKSRKLKRRHTRSAY